MLLIAASYTGSDVACKVGCPDAWLGDKYCDAMCNDAACGFDGGDCADAPLYSELAGFALTLDDDEYEVPRGRLAAYFNMSAVLGDQRVTDGSHNEPDLVRSATISQRRQLLVMTFRRNVTRTTVTVKWEAQVAVNLKAPRQIDVKVLNQVGLPPRYTRRF